MCHNWSICASQQKILHGPTKILCDTMKILRDPAKTQHRQINKYLKNSYSAMQAISDGFSISTQLILFSS